MVEAVGAQSQSPSPSPAIRLQTKILTMRHAIRNAGFRSGKFKPVGSLLRMEVLVPVSVEDWSMDEEAMSAFIKKRIAESVDAEPPAPIAPLMMPRPRGRPRKN